MFPTGLLTPEAVAGLALLAFLPRAKGQPVEDQLEVGFRLVGLDANVAGATVAAPKKTQHRPFPCVQLEPR